MAKDKVDEILFTEFHPEYVRQKEEERKRELEKLRRRKLRMVLLRGFLGLLAVFGIYLCLDVSKVREVSFSGNSYLSEKYLYQLAGVNANTRYPFVFPSYVSARLTSNPLIEKADVVMETDRTLRVRLTMKKVLGYHIVKSEPYIILADGDEVRLELEDYSVMSSIPFLKEFDDAEQRKTLVERLAGLDSQIIGGIAEIWPFVESYDAHMYRFIMNDGNQVFMSGDGIPFMASYYGIAANLGTSRACLMINEETSSAYTRSCAELNAEEAESIAKMNAKDDPGETKEDEGSEKPEEGTGEEEMTKPDTGE